MKKSFPVFLIFLLFLFSCATESTTIKKSDKNKFEFSSESTGLISIFPTYKYLGENDFSDQKALRKYYIWRNKDKYILIYHLVAKGGKTFPKDLKWIGNSGLLHKDGMRAAFDTMSERVYNTIKKFSDIKLIKGCFILAEEIHINRNQNEAVIRILIVPDEYCTGEYKNVMNELDRVAIIN